MSQNSVSFEASEMTAPSLLCVHPNYELYGSDRSFADAVKALLHAFPGRKIDVLLPRDGPITTLAPFADIAVKMRPLWVLRRRSLVRQFTIGLIGNLFRLYRAIRDINRAEVTYINTIVVFDFIFGARFSKKTVLIHVREIPTGLEMKIFRALILWSGGVLIFNSEATRNAYGLPASANSYVVHNGFADPGDVTLSRRNKQPDQILELLVIGRINHWKGQEIVIAALALLPDIYRQRVRCRIVGSVFNEQYDVQEGLNDLISRNNLTDCIKISPFEKDPSDSYRSADIVVIPSRLPEPFGRVAIEAMAHSKPVIASGHGGLREIVDDGVTGRLIPPGDPQALADALIAYMDQPELLTTHGAAGRKRFLGRFTVDVTNSALIEIIREKLKNLPNRKT
jgi:glycosyltransferase involved in cell wall biosynthesis